MHIKQLLPHDQNIYVTYLHHIVLALGLPLGSYLHAMQPVSLKKQKTSTAAPTSAIAVAAAPDEATRQKLPQYIHPVMEGDRMILSTLDAAKISSFGDVVCKGSTQPMRHVTALDLSSNRLRALPFGFGDLCNLVTLSLRDNDLQELFPDHWRFNNLTTLDISHTKVGKSKIIWHVFRSLKKLIASHADLTFFDNSICSLAALNFADFSHNRLLSMSAPFFSLTNLRYLNFSSNRLSELSTMLYQLQLLKELHLDNNHFQVLPSQIGSLKSLEVLSVKGNQLKTLPPELERLTTLRVLGLAENQLSEFPQQICQLVSLEDLDISSNKLESLSSLQAFLSGEGEPPFHKLVALTRLSVCDNQLKALPHTIVFLDRLKILLLSHNYLTRIPWELSKLQQVEELAMDNNSITELPGFVLTIKTLKKLSIGPNPIPDLKEKALKLREAIKLVLDGTAL